MRDLAVVSPRWFENILHDLETFLPNADFVIEGYVDPREPLRDSIVTKGPSDVLDHATSEIASVRKP